MQDTLGFAQRDNAKLSGTQREAAFARQWRSHAQKAAQCWDSAGVFC
jgi:hypothetical protein